MAIDRKGLLALGGVAVLGLGALAVGISDNQSSGGGGGDTITSPNGTLNVANNPSNTTLDVNTSAFPLYLQFAASAATTPSATGIGSDAAGDLLLYTPSTTQIQLWTDNVERWYVGFGGNLVPFADNTYILGSSALRVASFNGGTFNSYLASGDANPQVVLQSNAAGGQILLGLGGANVPSVRIENNGAGTTFMDTNAQAAITQFFMLPGTAGVGSTVASFSVYGVKGANAEDLNCKAVNQTSFTIAVEATGGGSYRPLLFYNNSAEAFRITTTPTVQFQPTAATILGSSTGYTTLTTANAGATNYTATFPAKTGTVAMLSDITAGVSVVASFTHTGKNAADTNAIDYTPPATAHTYRISYWFRATTATSFIINFTLTYKDESGTAQSFVLPVWDTLNSTWKTNPSGGDNGPAGGIYTFTTDNSTTVITLSTTNTFTNVVYDWGAALELLY